MGGSDVGSAANQGCRPLFPPPHTREAARPARDPHRAPNSLNGCTIQQTSAISEKRWHKHGGAGRGGEDCRAGNRKRETNGLRSIPPSAQTIPASHPHSKAPPSTPLPDIREDVKHNVKRGNLRRTTHTNSGRSRSVPNSSSTIKQPVDASGPHRVPHKRHPGGRADTRGSDQSKGTTMPHGHNRYARATRAGKSPRQAPRAAGWVRAHHFFFAARCSKHSPRSQTPAGAHPSKPCTA